MTSTDKPKPPTTPDHPDAPTKAAGDPASVKQPRARAAVWLRFVLVVAAVLAADLGLKAWSFANVADTPVRVRTAADGGPEVLIPRSSAGEAEGGSAQAGDDGPWRVVSKVGPMGEPPRIPEHDPVVVVPGALNFQLTLNTGAVFGIGQGGRPFFIIISVIAVGVVLFYLHRSPPRAWAYQVGLACILGGALGNLYDRVRYSAVRDMLHMLPDTGLWPWIFNIADVVLIVGVCLTMLVSILADRKAMKAKAAEA